MLLFRFNKICFEFGPFFFIDFKALNVAVYLSVFTFLCLCDFIVFFILKLPSGLHCLWMYIICGNLLLLSLCVPILSQKVCDPDDVKCLLKHDSRDVSLISTRPASNATLPCNAFKAGNVLKAEWWFGRRSKLVGVWMNTDQHANFEHYKVNVNSSLSIFDVNRDLVEEWVFNDCFKVLVLKF